MPDRLAASANGEASDEAPIYELRWPVQERESSRPSEAAGRWLILDDASGLGRGLESRLNARGGSCERIVLAGTDEPGTHAVDPADAEGFRRLLADGGPWRGVIHLWGLTDADPSTATLADLERSQVRGCGSVLRLVQTLAGLDGTTPRIWIATRGAQAIDADRPVTAPLQATLWGMGRSIALEHPEIWGGLIDLDPTSRNDEVAALLDEVLGTDGEDQVAFRDGQRHVARLGRREMPDVATRPLILRPEGTYLVTGGLGELGLRTARWLAKQGARRLVLVGRRELPGRETWDHLPGMHPSRGVIEAIERLERLGATVVVASADVADPGAVATLFDQLRRTLPPIRGIVHAAGVVGPRSTREADLEAFLTTLRPKVAGTWLLRRAARDWPLDFFVGFSSLASLLGAKGLAYAAANAFLDACAHDASGRVPEFLSVNWGPWEAGGLAALDDLARTHRLLGLAPLRTESALGALEYLLGSGAYQATVADVDWSALRALRSREGRGRLLEDLAEPSDPEAETIGGGRLAWLTLSPERRRDWLIGFLRERSPRRWSRRRGRSTWIAR